MASRPTTERGVHFDADSKEANVLEAESGIQCDGSLGYHLPTSGFKFRQQVTSLIESVSLSHRKFQDFENFFNLLKNHLLGIPSSELVPLEVSRKQLKKSGIRIPLASPIDPVEWQFIFIPPKQVEIVGSWAIKNAIITTPTRKNQHATIDVLIQIPQGVLQAKDYLSNRYFHKRAHYLAHISKSLLASPFTETYEFNYSFLNGDSFKPIIEIKPKEDSKSSPPRWTARLLLSYSQEVFPISKLTPSNANLKPCSRPTPDYNQSVLMDSYELNLRHHAFFTQTSKKYPAFIPTCQLMKAWARRKVYYNRPCNSGMSCGLFGFGHFGWLINFLVAQVLLGSREGSSKAPLGGAIIQSDPAALWKHVIDWLAQWNVESLISMKAMDNSQPFSVEEFRAFDSALIDPSGTVNLIAGIPLITLKLLCASAQRTASLLKSDHDVFPAIFSRAAYSFASSFDYHFVLKVSNQDVIRLCEKEERRGILAALQILSKELQTAMGKRVLGAAFLYQLPVLSVKLDKKSEPVEPVPIQVGLVLDLAHAFNLVTYGPSPDSSSTELEQFCQFWGTKADLRRFQDGSIKQCVSWEVKNPLERMQIVKQILGWLVIEKLKFDDNRSILWDFVGNFDPFILENPKQVLKIYTSDPKEIGFTHVMKMFNEFVKQLKSLKEKELIPLAITSVQAESEYLRYSSVFIPGPRQFDGYEKQPSTTKYLPSLLCHLRLESSGKWPESLEAIQKIKAALLVKIAEGLEEGGQVVDSKIVFDYKALPISQNVTLDVLHSSGYAFKLMICYEREEMLLEETLAMNDKHVRDKPECKKSWALEALSIYRKTFIHSRKHHDAISALQARFPSFTYTVRLVKRWFSAHMLLSTHVSIELVELLASVVYLLSEDELPPTTGSSGFIRFLKFLKRWDWRKEPLLLPLHTSTGLATHGLSHFPVDSVKSSIEKFNSVRKQDPGFHQFTYFVATEDDLDGSRWMISSSLGFEKRSTSHGAINRPTRLIADRIQALASASIDVLEPSLEAGSMNFEPKIIFKSPLQDYDFHLVIDLSCSTRLHQSLDQLTPIDQTTRQMGTPPQIDDDPILEFVQELQSIYGDSIEFFYDRFGGPLIGGVMNRSLLERPKTFKLNQIEYLTQPTLDQDQDHDGDEDHYQAPKVGRKKSSGGPDDGKNDRRHRKKVILDLDGCLLEIIDGIGRGLVARILKKGVDY